LEALHHVAAQSPHDVLADVRHEVLLEVLGHQDHGGDAEEQGRPPEEAGYVAGADDLVDGDPVEVGRQGAAEGADDHGAHNEGEAPPIGSDVPPQPLEDCDIGDPPFLAVVLHVQRSCARHHPAAEGHRQDPSGDILPAEMGGRSTARSGGLRGASSKASNWVS